MFVDVGTGYHTCLVFFMHTHILNRNDWWLPVGMAGFIAGLFVRRMFGSTEYQYWVMQVSWWVGWGCLALCIRNTSYMYAGFQK